MRQILSNATPAAKIFYLFLMSLGGFMLLSLVMGSVMIASPQLASSVWFIHTSTIFQAVVVFLLPTYLVLKWTPPEPLRYLKLRENGNIERELLFGILMFVFSYVFVSFLNQWNKSISFPESFQAIEQWMRTMEDNALETTDKLLSGKSIPEFVANLLIIAGLAAFAEEIFFRGALQQFIKEWLKNGHAAVWLSALVFSAMHLQFFGFFPRLALGALLGYVFLYTRNLWIAILVHFINNALVIAAMFFWGETDWFAAMEEVPLTPAYAIAALISLIATAILLRNYKLRTRNSKLLKQ